MKYLSELTRAVLPLVIVGAIAGGVGYFQGQQSLTPEPAVSTPSHQCHQEWNPTMPKSHELVCIKINNGNRYR